MIEAQQTRDRIIAAAREVSICKGKRGATTREIADLAGVNEVTVFRHFGNKESLIRAVVKASSPNIELRETISRLHGPIEDDLHTIGVILVNHLESIMLRMSLVETECENSIFSERHDITEYFRTRIESRTISGDPDDLASVFIGMIFSRAISREKFPRDRLFNDTEYAIQFFVDVFLNGVRSKE